MATAVKSNVGELGIGIQGAEGTALGTAAFKHPVVSGVIPKIIRDEKNMEITVATAEALVPGRYASSQHWELDSTWWATERASGPWFKAMLGGLSTAGTADPYTHTMVGSGTPGFVTVFANGPGSGYWKCGDGTMTALNLSFEAGEPLMVNGQASGQDTTYGTSWTSTVDDAPTSAGSWFTMIGSTFAYDEATTPATTAKTTVESGTLSLTRDVEQILTTAFVPTHRGLGPINIELALTMMFVDYNAYRNYYFGGVSGTTDNSDVSVGSFTCTFAQGPTSSANRTLTIAVPSVRLMVPEPPEVDPGGSPFRVNVTGVAVKPSSGEIVTVTLKSEDSTF